MRYMSSVLLLLVGLLVQVALLRFVTVLGVAPDVLLLATVVVGLRRGQIAGMLFGFLSGLAVDLATATLVGPSALGYTIVGFVAGLWYGYSVGLNRGASMMVVVLCSSVHEFVMAAIHALTPGAGLGFLLLRWALPGVLYTSLVGLMVFLLLPQKMWRPRAATSLRGLW